MQKRGQMSTKEPSRSVLWAAAEPHLPRGWEIVEHKPGRDGKFKDPVDNVRLYGLADWDHKKLHCVQIVNRYGLCVLLHECAHVLLHHVQLDGKDTAQAEFEAEQYAIRAARAAGLSVPKRYLIDARDYVRAHVQSEPFVEHSTELLRFAYGKEWREHQ